MASIAANTVQVSQPSVAATNKSEPARATDMDSVFAALLAKSTIPDPTNPVQDAGTETPKNLMALLQSKHTTSPLDLLEQMKAKREARQQARAQARDDAANDTPDGLLASFLQRHQALPADIVEQLKALSETSSSGAAQFDLDAFKAAHPELFADPTVHQGNDQERNLAHAVDRFIKTVGVPADRAAKLEASVLSRPDAFDPLPGTVRDKQAGSHEPSLDALLEKVGINTDSTKLPASDRATAALTELANQGMKHATSKEAVEARLLPQTQTGDNVQAGDRNAQAGSDQSHRDPRQDPRLEQRQDPSVTRDAGNSGVDARTQTQTATTQTQNNAQTAFQNTVDAAQAALPSGGAQASTVTAALHVAPRAHSDAQTAQPDIGAIAINIAAKSQSGAKHFDIRLDPPEMGRIDVRLSVDDTGKAQAMLSADNQQTLDLLQRDKSTLERALKDSGLDLGNNGLNFSLKGQDRQASDASDRKSGRRLDISAVPQVDRAGNLLQPHILPIDNTRLDIRV